MKSLRIAVTGGIACGKSTVARMLLDFGGDILDTDNVAHDLEAAGGAAVPEIARVFGKDVIAEDGSVDRRKLGAKVFTNQEALAKLNSILHPMIANLVDEWMEKETDAPFKAILVPLLYEAGFDKKVKWDKILAVVCSTEEQIRRIKGRGFSEDEALARIRAQLPCEEKAKKADYAIWNDADIRTLECEVKKALDCLLA